MFASSVSMAGLVLTNIKSNLMLVVLPKLQILQLSSYYNRLFYKCGIAIWIK